MIKELGLERPVLVTPSMSGSFAMPFVFGDAATCGERIRAFVPVAPVGATGVSAEDYKKCQVHVVIGCVGHFKATVYAIEMLLIRSSATICCNLFENNLKLYIHVIFVHLVKYFRIHVHPFLRFNTPCTTSCCSLSDSTRFQQSSIGNSRPSQVGERVGRRSRSISTPRSSLASSSNYNCRDPSSSARPLPEATQYHT